MQNQKGFIKIVERSNGDIFWNGSPVEKLGGNKLKIEEDIYNLTENLQNVLNNTSNLPLKKLNDKDKEIYDKILDCIDFKNYKPIRGETNQLDTKTLNQL